MAPVASDSVAVAVIAAVLLPVASRELRAAKIRHRFSCVINRLDAYFNKVSMPYTYLYNINRHKFILMQD